MESKFYKRFPVMITIAMIVIVLVQSISTVYIICYCVSEEIPISTIWNTCKELFAGNFITLGISIIAIAVSVWIGLNINIAIDKAELSEKILNLDRQNKDNLKSYNDKHEKTINEYKERYEEDLDKLRKEYVDCLKIQWINMILSMSYEYPLSEYLGSILKDINISGNMELIDFLMRYESQYILVANLYESEQRGECVTKAEELLNWEINTKIIADDLRLYFNIRESDLHFYKCACEIRNGKKGEEQIEELEKSLFVYKTLESDRDILNFNNGKKVYAYVCNTIGYSYDLMNQIIPDGERKSEAIRYMEKAIDVLKNEKSKKRGRYYRN